MKEQNQSFLTVSQLTQEIKDALETGFEWVQVCGEISNFKKAPSGHAYFRLKDDQAVIDAVAWRSTVARWAGLDLEDGVEVIAGGRISVYPPRGQYQLVVSAIRLAGIGALQQQFEALKKKLAEEGLFDSARKKPLPDLPQKVAVITSANGAALQDFLKILNGRQCPVHTIVCPVLVQGQEAGGQIVEMLERVNKIKDIELIVLCRGGGSMEDLWAFNEERVARAISKSAKPVLTGIGHEVDFTIADFVSDYRAPTPTGAAQVICDIFDEKRAALHMALDRFRRSLLPTLRQEREQLNAMRATLRRYHPAVLLSIHRQRLDDLSMRMIRNVKAGMRQYRQELDETREQLMSGASRYQKQIRQELERREKLLKSYDPTRILKRGYAICRDKNGRILQKSSEAQAGDMVLIQLGEGSLESEVKKQFS